MSIIQMPSSSSNSPAEAKKKMEQFKINATLARAVADFINDKLDVPRFKLLRADRLITYKFGLCARVKKYNATIWTDETVDFIALEAKSLEEPLHLKKLGQEEEEQILQVMQMSGFE